MIQEGPIADEMKGLLRLTRPACTDEPIIMRRIRLPKELVESDPIQELEDIFRQEDDDDCEEFVRT